MIDTYIHGTYNIILFLGGKRLRFITRSVSWIIWNHHPFHLKCVVLPAKFL